MPSREASLQNLAKARLRWRPPRPWRSRAEGHLIRLFAWHWHLGHGPWCSGRALALWLGVSHTYIQKLTQALSKNETDFLREVAKSGPPTTEGLRRAREESRQQRERGLLRTQRRWKTVEYKTGRTVVRGVLPNQAQRCNSGGQQSLPGGCTNSNNSRKTRLHRRAYVEPQNECRT